MLRLIMLRILKALSDDNSYLKNDLNRELGYSIQELNVIAKKISQIILSTYVEGQFIGLNIYCDAVLAEEMQSLLKKIITIIYEIINILSGIISINERNSQKTYELENLMRDLLLLLQFDILTCH